MIFVKIFSNNLLDSFTEEEQQKPKKNPRCQCMTGKGRPGVLSASGVDSLFEMIWSNIKHLQSIIVLLVKSKAWTTDRRGS